MSQLGRRLPRGLEVYLALNAVWLGPALLGLALLAAWAFTSLRSVENRVTPEVALAACGRADLRLCVQYPSRIESTGSGPVVVFPGPAPSPVPVSADVVIGVPAGLVVLTDAKGVPAAGKLPITFEPGASRPVGIRAEHARTRPASHARTARFTVSVGVGDRPIAHVPELDFSIPLETALARVAREVFAGTRGFLLAMPALLLALVGAGYRFHYQRKRIFPLYQQLGRALGQGDLARALELCRQILAIDPTYDSIADVYQTAQERLDELFHEAYRAELATRFVQARVLYERVLAADSAHKGARERLEQMTADLQGLADLGYRAAYRRGPSAGPGFLPDSDRVALLWAGVPEVAVAGLADAARAGTPAQRRRVASVLGLLDAQPLGDLLQVLSDDEDRSVREAAEAAWRAAEERSRLRDLVQRLRSNEAWEAAAAELLERGEASIPLLVPELGADWPYRMRAADVLRQIAGAQLPEVLRFAAESDIPAVAAGARAMLEDGAPARDEAGADDRGTTRATD
jgi:hypothetical protein